MGIQSALSSGSDKWWRPRDGITGIECGAQRTRTCAQLTMTTLAARVEKTEANEQMSPCLLHPTRSKAAVSKRVFGLCYIVSPHLLQ